MEISLSRAGLAWSQEGDFQQVSLSRSITLLERELAGEGWVVNTCRGFLNTRFIPPHGYNVEKGTLSFLWVDSCNRYMYVQILKLKGDSQDNEDTLFT